jgi:purine-binding chemotaxis protein CheW
MSTETLHVSFKVGGGEYVLPAADVLQMESYSGSTPVPGTPSWVAGLVQVRGRVVPVVDLRARFGLPATPPTIDTRVVVAKDGGRVVGLVVDSAREVLRIAAEQFKPAPEILVDQASGWVKAVAQSGNRLVMLIDFKKIVGEESIHGQ